MKKSLTLAHKDCIIRPQGVDRRPAERGGCAIYFAEHAPTGRQENDSVVSLVDQLSDTKCYSWVGYILDIDGMRIYTAGDTDATKEARTVKCDIAMIPIGGTYTMNYKEAAKLVNEIRPGYAIPTHYGRLAGKKSDGDDFMKLVDDGIRVELKL